MEEYRNASKPYTLLAIDGKHLLSQLYGKMVMLLGSWNYGCSLFDLHALGFERKTILNPCSTYYN